MSATYAACSPIVRPRTVTPMTPDLRNIMPKIADHTISNHTGSMSARRGGPRNASTYYNDARGTLYSRYSHSEWKQSNHHNFNLSEQERAQGERLRNEAYHAVKSTDTRTKNRQTNNTKRLEIRVSEISTFHEVITEECRDMTNEISKLEEFKAVLEKAHADTRGPLSIAEECLLQREKRQGIDLVHDEVEKQLTREVAVIKKCQEKMQKLIEKSNVQLKLNRAALHACDRDSKDKFHAQTLDDRMQQLRNTSAGIGFHPGVEAVDNTVTIPHSWMRFSQENLARSQKERENSERLRGEIDASLRAFANAMWSQFNTVNNAFNTRINETRDNKNTLQAHLQKTMYEIADMERTIGLLRRAIYDKEAPMKVAQSRLQERTNRINVELCNDPSMQGLQREVTEIRDSVQNLKAKLRSAENAHVRLNKVRQTLEQDIAVKENSLMIDSKYCMGMRKNMPLDPKTGPIFTMPL